MRKAALVFGPFTFLAAAVFACEEDSNGLGSPGFSLDGSTTPFDGSAPPVDGNVPPTPDASPDAPPQVTITATGRSGPVANVRVVFHDATGAVMETKLTGADGKATSSGNVLPAMASALVASGSERHIVTWTGLENGDELALRGTETGDFVGQYHVTFSGPFEDAGATHYDVYANGCSWFTEGTELSIDLYRSCIGTQGSVLAYAKDVDNVIVGHSFKKANAVPADGGVLDIATGPWKGSTNVSVTAQNLPNTGSASAELLEISDGHGFAADESRRFDGDTVTFPSAQGFAEAQQASVTILPGNLGSTQVIAKRIAPTTAITIDAAQVLPAITSSTLEATNARRPVISWSASSTAGSDGGLIRVRFYGPEDYTYHWTFVVAPGSTTVTAPAMPLEAEGFLPPSEAGPTAFGDPEVVFIEADTLPGYAAFRRQQGALVSLQTEIGYFSIPAMPVNGTYRATSYKVTR